jgi:hypothetical protein
MHMSKTLVITYSYTGTGRRLAKLLCAQQDWPAGDVLELRARAGAWGTVRCILDSVLSRHPSVRYVGPPLKEFDSVVLIAPVWLGRLAGPMRSFVANYSDSLPDLAVISVMGSNDTPSTAAEVARLAQRTPLLATAFNTREVDDGSCAARLRAFGTALRSGRNESRPERPAEVSSQAA